MAFQVLEISFSVARDCRGVVQALRQSDPDLCSQLQRAVSSVALNLSEGSRREGRDRRHHYRVAAGSADEARSALRLAKAWGYVSEDTLQKPLEGLDSVLAILWRLTH